MSGYGTSRSSFSIVNKVLIRTREPGDKLPAVLEEVGFEEDRVANPKAKVRPMSEIY
jgi:hypothetical protein